MRLGDIYSFASAYVETMVLFIEDPVTTTFSFLPMNLSPNNWIILFSAYIIIIMCLYSIIYYLKYVNTFMSYCMIVWPLDNIFHSAN